jgi:hypothetical protein
MTGSSQSVVESFVTLLEDNLVDTNSYRASLGKKWIYDDIPRLDVKYYPRISVIGPTSTSEPHELGCVTQRFSPRIEVQVRVKKGMKLTIGGVSKRDIQILDIVSKQATDLLKLASSRETLLNDNSVFYSVLETENTSYGEFIIIRQLIYKNTLKR